MEWSPSEVERAAAAPMGVGGNGEEKVEGLWRGRGRERQTGEGGSRASLKKGGKKK